jgi:hypothetical protein
VRRKIAMAVSVLVLGVVLPFAPGAAASSGGFAAPSVPGDRGTSGSAGDLGDTDPGSLPPPPPAPGGGASLVTSPVTVVGGALAMRGAVGAGTGRGIWIERLGPDGSWTTIVAATADSRGEFTATWRPDRTGRLQLRARRAEGGGPASAAVADRASQAQSTVYSAANATWFGPGFYGKRTACGQRMTRRLKGVAHRSLPCGTQVEIYYRGRVVTVPVVDRGPYNPRASFDLTRATARALGADGVARIGVLVPDAQGRGKRSRSARG